MEIITGCTGSPHVYAIDNAEIYKMILGTAEMVLPTANKLVAEMNGTNKVRVKAGSLIMQGRLAKTRAAEGYTEVSIDSGTLGYYREDLIVAEYYTTTETTTDESGNEVTWTKEHIDLKAVKGTPDASQYLEPAITTGDIDSGQINQMKLWAVKLNGINFDSLVDFRVLCTDTALNLVTEAMTGIPNIATKAIADVNAAVASGKTDITTAKDEAIAAIMASGGVDAYTKTETDNLISGFKNISSSTINIPVATWDATNLNCTVSASGVSANNAVVVTPDPASMDVYSAAGIVCTAQAAGTLTFTCKTVPTAAIAVNVMVVG